MELLIKHDTRTVAEPELDLQNPNTQSPARTTSYTVPVYLIIPLEVD